MPKVYNKHHKDAPANATYVGRPTKFGNPFSHMEETSALYKAKNRQEAVEKFKEWIFEKEQDGLRERIKIELRGKDLVCFCKPLCCHADVILEIANED